MSSPAGRALGKAYESGIFPLREDAALVFIPVQFPAYSDVYSGTPVHSGLFRLIPAYSAVFRLVRAYSVTPVFRLQFGVFRPQFGVFRCNSGTPVVPVAIRCISAAIRPQFGVFRSYSGRERRMLQPAQKNFTGRPSMAESRLLAADEAPMRKRSVVSHSLPRISSTIV